MLLGKRGAGEASNIEVSTILRLQHAHGSSMPLQLWGPKSYQILRVKLLSSFAHHYWLKNGAGFDLVGEAYPGIWTLEKTSVGS